jgi:two-component system nitrate/nitrite response regulator NarL
MNPSSSAKPRVALLEPEALLRGLLVEALSHEGCDVRVACRDHWDFLGRLAVEQSDVSIMDFQAIEKSGLSQRELPTLLQALRRYHPGLGLIVLADARNRAVVELCCRERVHGCLDRDNLPLDELKSAVVRAAAGERMLPLQVLKEEFAMRARPPRRDIDPLLQCLSPREHEVLRHIAAGLDNLKVSALLGISERTVKSHVSSLYRKLGADNRTELALWALRSGVQPSLHA